MGFLTDQTATGILSPRRLHLVPAPVDWCGTRSSADPPSAADHQEAGGRRAPTSAPSVSSKQATCFPARPAGQGLPTQERRLQNPPRRNHSLGTASPSICCSLRSLWNADSFSTEGGKVKTAPSKMIPGVSCLLSTAALGPGPGGPLGPVGRRPLKALERRTFFPYFYSPSSGGRWVLLAGVGGGGGSAGLSPKPPISLPV